MDSMYSNDDIKNEIDDVWSQNEQIIKIMTEMNEIRKCSHEKETWQYWARYFVNLIGDTYGLF